MWKVSRLNPKYEVNEKGQVRHILRKNILKGSLVKGYQIFSMYDENMKRKDYYCHILVATEFIDNPNHYTEVNHINFNKTDNRVENLEWVSHSQNMEHWRKEQDFYTSLELNEEINKDRFQKKVPVEQYNLQGIFIKRYESYTEAEKVTGISSGRISLVARGKRHTAGGFVWKDVLNSSTTIQTE